MKNLPDTIKQATTNGKTVFIDLWYPRSDDQLDTLEIGLMDIRAADAIQVSYDFKRDGWMIKQAAIFAWEDEECNADWQEVAFIQAWAREHA